MFSCFERTLSRKGISMISLLLDHQSWMISTFVVTGAMGETRPDIRSGAELEQIRGHALAFWV